MPDTPADIGRKYPEHRKMKAVKERSQTVGEFVEWLGDNGVVLCEYEERYRGGAYHPTSKPIEQLLADFFEIDLKRVSEEKDAMVEELRRQATNV